MNETNNATATITVHDDATPSAHYPADEQAENGAMDYSVTIEIVGSTPATIEECGNGWPDVGDFVCGDDGEVYRMLSTDGRIQTGSPGQGNWIDALVELADWSDVEVLVCTAVIGERARRVIEGSITLYRDDANGGMSPCGTPIEGWCSGEIVAWLRTLDARAQRAAVSLLAGGVGAEDVAL